MEVRWRADSTINDKSTSDFLAHYMSEYGAFVQRVLDVAAKGRIGDRDPYGKG